MSVVCNRGDVRVTKSEMVHGFTARETEEARKTVLSWFCGVRNDNKTLDNEESER